MRYRRRGRIARASDTSCSAVLGPFGNLLYLSGDVELQKEIAPSLSPVAVDRPRATNGWVILSSVAYGVRFLGRCKASCSFFRPFCLSISGSLELREPEMEPESEKHSMSAFKHPPPRYSLRYPDIGIISSSGSRSRLWTYLLPLPDVAELLLAVLSCYYAEGPTRQI